MKLTPPRNVTFWIAVILGVLGVLSTVTKIGFVTPNAIWFVAVGLLVLVLGNLLRDF